MQTKFFSKKLTVFMIVFAGMALLLAYAWASEEKTPLDSTMVLRGGEEGTVFRSLTVEGEDRIRIEFNRPTLELDLDPHQAPGLEWESTQEVLNRDLLDLISPLLNQSAYQRSPYLPRPWLDRFASGEIVHFHPALEGVEHWQLTIANSQGQTVASFQGDGNPPKKIGWDGLSLDGVPMPPGLTYSYVLEAFDRAGNKRNFVGEGFDLPPYRQKMPDGFIMLFSGCELSTSALPNQRGIKAPPSPILLECASWINQVSRPDHLIHVGVMARTFDQAKALAQDVVHKLKPLLLGDPIRIQYLTDVQPDAPSHGVVTIEVSH
jgi:hypothetical protein